MSLEASTEKDGQCVNLHSSITRFNFNKIRARISATAAVLETHKVNLLILRLFFDYS